MKNFLVDWKSEFYIPIKYHLKTKSKENKCHHLNYIEKEQRKNSNEKYRLIAQSVFSILILYVSMSHMVGLPVIPYLNMINYPLK